MLADHCSTCDVCVTVFWILREQRGKIPNPDGWWKELVGERRKEITGKEFWEVITLNLNSEDEQELVCEDKQVLGKKKSAECM